MDPIDRLRALRDDARWMPAEVELDASPVAGNGHAPVRGRRAGWRFWGPRLGVGVLVTGAVAALAVAVLGSGLGSNVGRWNGPVVGAVGTATPSPAVSGPSASSPPPSSPLSPPPAACAPAQLTPSLHIGGGAMGTFYVEVELRNYSWSACTLFTPATVSWAKGAMKTGAEPGAVGRAATVPDPGTSVEPGQALYLRIGIAEAVNFPTARCQPVTADWLHLSFPDSSGGFSDYYLPASALQQACSSTAVQQLTAAPLSSTPTVQVSSPAAVPMCAASELETSLIDPDAAASGVWGVEIVLTNVGTQPCRLSGSVEVQYVGSDAKLLGAPAQPFQPASAVLSVVPIAPGASAYERIDVADLADVVPSGCAAVTPAGFAVTFPGSTARPVVKFTRIKACVSPKVQQLTMYPLSPTSAFAN
ncbi:MAG: DUF4232 domain-containing protein [Microbacteriaceae bacterium]|nr:DUF4232 domain-containing protein [Microbacteriaceae bacterium]MCL2793666.1 DUF4232 domain-containing protein [Microbacteriaceae bacterium]